MEEIKFFKEKMIVMLADMKEKEARAEALAEEVENLPDNLTRYNSYVHVLRCKKIKIICFQNEAKIIKY